MTNTDTNNLLQMRILIPTLSKPELDTIQSDIRRRIVEVAGDIKYQLLPGTKVIVSGGKTHKHDKGEIIKVNRSRAQVRINNSIWNVPFTLISLDI